MFPWASPSGALPPSSLSLSLCFNPSHSSHSLSPLLHYSAPSLPGSHLNGNVFAPSAKQGVGPVPAGLAGDLGRGGGLAGV